MFSSVSDLEQPLASVVGALDPDALSGGQARQELLSVIRLKKLLDGAEIRLLARVEETGSWRGDGDRTVEDWLLRKNGGSYGAAKRATETAGLLPAAPAVDEALRAGKISADQAALLAPAAKEAPAQADRLVEKAESQTLRDTKQAADRARAAARTEAQEAERAAKQQARRRLLFGTDADGNGTIEAHLPPEVFAEVKAELERLFKAVFAAARRAGRFESHGAYFADALVEACRRSRAGTKKPKAKARHMAGTDDPGPSDEVEPDGDEDEVEVKPAPTSKTAVSVIIDFETLQGRSRDDGQERCEIAGVGPVSAAWVRDQLGDATLRLFLRNGKDLRTLASPGRSPTQDMLVCLDILYPECAIEGCPCTRGLEDHHDTSATGWHDTKRTQLSELTRLCKYHHDLVTHEGYTLVRGPTPTATTLKAPDVPPPPRKRWGKNKRRPNAQRTESTPAQPTATVAVGPAVLPFDQGPDG